MIVVTGGAGFIGSHLTRALLKRDYSIIKVIDDLSAGSISNLWEISENNKALHLHTGSITYLDYLVKQFHEAKKVYHLAGSSNVAKSIEDPIKTAEINIMGTLNVLEAARRTKVKRVVFVSSSSVYYKLSPYAVQKAAAEDLCKLYTSLYGLDVVIVRYFSVYGPNQSLDRIVPRFLTEEPATIYGDGKQLKSFTYVTDAVEGTILAMDTRKSRGKTFDIGDDPISVNELFSIIGPKLSPKYEKARPGEVRDSVVDSSLARNLLGWEPRMPMVEGLDETRKYIEGLNK